MPHCRSIGVRWLAAVLIVALAGTARQRAAAQQPGADLDTLMADAQKAYRERRWDAAAATYQSIRDLARQRGDDGWEARGLLGLGSVDCERQRYADARVELLAALKTFEAEHELALVGRANDTLGRVATAFGDYQESEERSRKAVAAFEAVGDRRSRAHAAARVLSFERDPAAEDRAYIELLADARALGDLQLEGDVLHHKGDFLFNHGDYEGAIEKLDMAAAAFAKTNASASLATVYTSLGRLYRVHGQPGAALKYQLKSLEFAERSGTPRTHVQSLNAVGVAYEALGDFTRAREYFERALTAAETIGSPPLIEFLRANLGGFFAFAGEPERARILLEEVVAHGTEQHLAMRYDQLSTAYHDLGRYDDARAAAERALDLCAKETPLECVYASLHLADAELGLKHEAAALASYEPALKTLEEIHGKLAASDFLKQEFHHFWEPTYSIGIDLHFRRGEFREALETAELARARGFLDLLASRDIEPDTRPVPAMTALQMRGAATTLSSRAAVSAPNASDLAAIAARLHSTMVVYWVGRDSVYMWVVSPDGTVRGTTVKVASARLTELIRTTSPFAQPSGIRSASTATTRGDQPIALTSRKSPAWRELYDLLIKPIERDLPRTIGARLTIVPHGPLLHLPFAALRDAQGRYLVERYTIHSVPAAAVLQFTGERLHPNARSGQFLLVADPAAPPKLVGEPALPRLPGAIEEAHAIARLVPASRSILLADTSATETRLRASLPQRSVVHFATHAIVSDADPLSSFLALGADRDSDGKLTAQKIYRLKLDADLIVLSACRSGDGVVTGDGIAGLARAFFYAGAPSLVVSLWDVADAPTSRLVPAFYRAWLRGTDKAGALRSAQLALIRDLRNGRVKVTTPAGEIAIPEDPAFWAGFILLGEPD
jgi:CHAT domain-containing protein/tetratricopeptide (TPR) repeat protein